jgi:cell volume regulation protein A
MQLKKGERMEVSFLFMIAGIIIMTGFFGIFFFDKTKIPDVLLLLGVGLLLGPVLGLIDPGSLDNLTEYFGSLALIIILFEGGMDMDLDRLIIEFGAASFLVAVSFVLSMTGIAAFLHFIQGWEIMQSLLLGAILGCTSAAIVMPIISRMEIKEEIKTIVSVESALSDVLAVVLTITLIEVITLGTIGIRTPFRAVASSFSTAIIGGGLAGIFWLKVLDYFRDRKYSYMFTLAAVLVTFGAVRFLGGSGAIAVLIFGIILGNSHSFARFLKISNDSLIESTIKFFHGEMTFFVRTFFFVYMGMIITFKQLDLSFFLVCLSILLIIVVMRYMSVGLTSLLFKEKKPDRLIMMSMLPRGLASAVLAIMPASMNIRGSESFVDITFAIIILTNCIMTLGVYSFDKGMKKAQ